MAKHTDSETDPYTDYDTAGSGEWGEISDGTSDVEKKDATDSTDPGENPKPPNRNNNSRLPELFKPVIDISEYLPPDPNAETGMPARERLKTKARPTILLGDNTPVFYSPPSPENPTPVIPFRTDIPPTPETPVQVEWTPTEEVPHGTSFYVGSDGDDPDTEVEDANPIFSKRCTPNAMYQQLENWLYHIVSADEYHSPEERQMLRNRIMGYVGVFQTLLSLPPEYRDLDQTVRMKLAKIGGGISKYEFANSDLPELYPDTFYQEVIIPGMEEIVELIEDLEKNIFNSGFFAIVGEDGKLSPEYLEDLKSIFIAISDVALRLGDTEFDKSLNGPFGTGSQRVEKLQAMFNTQDLTVEQVEGILAVKLADRYDAFISAINDFLDPANAETFDIDMASAIATEQSKLIQLTLLHMHEHIAAPGIELYQQTIDPRFRQIDVRRHTQPLIMLDYGLKTAAQLLRLKTNINKLLGLIIERSTIIGDYS